MANINTFKSKLKGGGARANQFEVHMNFPSFAGGASEAEEMTFLCTSTTTPASTVSEVPVAFRGRTLYLAGDRTFETWSTTVINDTDFKIYRAVERWLNGINDLETNESARINPVGLDSYMVDAEITHLDRNSHPLKRWKFNGLFPTALPGIALDYGTNDAIETFDVTWRYQWFTTDSGGLVDPGDSVATGEGPPGRNYSTG